MKIFQNQTKLTIKLVLGSSIEDVQQALIKYRKPDRTEGSFVATVESQIGGLISYVVQSPNDIDQYGAWDFWANITFNDGRNIVGSRSSVYVYKEGIG